MVKVEARPIEIQPGQIWAIDRGQGTVEIEVDRITGTSIWYRGPLTGKLYRPLHLTFFTAYGAQFVADNWAKAREG